MPDSNQIAFSGGIISETAWGRADIDKWSVGMAEALNIVPSVQGSANNRAGFQYIDQLITDTGKVRLIPFTYNNDDSYVLAFSAGRIHIIKNGLFIQKDFKITANPGSVGATTTIEASELEANNGDEIELQDLATARVADWGNGGYESAPGQSETTITHGRYKLINRTDTSDTVEGLSSLTPPVVTATGHPFTNGDHVYITGLIDNSGNTWGEVVNADGGIPLFKVANSVTDTFELQELDGSNVPGAGWSHTFGSGGTIRHRTFDLANKLSVDVNSTGWAAWAYDTTDEISWLYSVATNYAEDDIVGLDIRQTANIMTIVHREYPVAELTRLADDSWTLTDVNFDVTTVSPTALVGNPNSRSDSKFYADNNNEFMYQQVRGYTPGTLIGAGHPGYILNIDNHLSLPTFTTTNSEAGGGGAETFHNLVVGEFLILHGLGGGSGEWEDLNDTIIKVIAVPTNSTFTAKRPDGTALNTNSYTAYTTIHSDSLHRDYGWCEVRTITNTNPAVVAITAYDSEIKTTRGPFPDQMSDPHSLKNDEKMVFSGLVVTDTTSFTQSDSVLNGANIVLKNKSRIVPDPITGTPGAGIEPSVGLMHYEMFYTLGAAVNLTPSGFGNIIDGSSAWFGVEFRRYAVTAVSKKTSEESLAVEMPVGLASDTPSPQRPFSLGWTAPVGGDIDYYNIYFWQNGVYGFIGVMDPANISSAPYFQDINFAPELGDNPPDDPVRNPFQSKFDSIDIATGIISSEDHQWNIGDRVKIDGIVPTTFEQNGTTVYVSGNDYTADQFKIKLTNQSLTDIDMSAYSPGYTSGGYAADWPGAVGYHSQRRGFASQFNKRQTVHWSATGLDSVFSAQENAFSYTVTEAGANEIRHIVTGRSAFLFTSGSVIDSNSGDVGFALENVVNREQTNDGVSSVIKPIKMRDSVVYVQDSKSNVYDLAYSFESDSYGGENLTILVPHLIENDTIVNWAFQPGPEPVIWFVMSNGSLKSMTYDKLNKVFAWAEHEFAIGSNLFQTIFEDVEVIPESGSWSLYATVKFRINPTTYRKWLVRLWRRNFTKIQDCKFLDSYLSLDDPVSITAITEDPTTDSIKVTAAGHGLVDDDIAEIDECEGSTELNLRKFRIAESDGILSGFWLMDEPVSPKANITSITADGAAVVLTHDETHTIATGDAVFLEATGITDSISTIDEIWMRAHRITDTTFYLTHFNGNQYNNLSPGTWTGFPSALTGTFRKGTIIDKADISAYRGSTGVVRKCATTVSGLSHLEGLDVSVLADGNVETGLTVTSGSITLSEPSARVHVGMPYTSRIQSLPLNTPRAELNGRIRTLNRVTARVYRSRGLAFGQILSKLVEPDSRSNEAWNEAANYYDGEISLTLKPYSDGTGQIYIEQVNPLPMTVQNMGLNFDLGDE